MTSKNNRDVRAERADKKIRNSPLPAARVPLEMVIKDKEVDLHDRPFIFIGGAEGIRTPGLQSAILLRSIQ